MKKFLVALGGVVFLASCSTVSQYRIEDSLKDIGVPPNKAECIGGQLRDRLDSKELGELADFLTDLAKADSAGEGLDATLEIDNPAIVGAITASGISCAFAPTGR